MVLGLLNVLNYLSIVVHLIGYVRDVTYPGNGICGAFRANVYVGFQVQLDLTGIFMHGKISRNSYFLNTTNISALLT